jgi:hypothetical protein
MQALNIVTDRMPETLNTGVPAPEHTPLGMDSANSLSLFECGLPTQLLDIVTDRMPEILKMGVPIPEHIPLGLDNVNPRVPNGQIQNETQLSKPQRLPAACGDGVMKPAFAWLPMLPHSAARA